MPCGTCHLACNCREERIAGLVAALEQLRDEPNLKVETIDGEMLDNWIDNRLATYRGDES